MLGWRLADLQYFQHEWFAGLAREEHFRTESIPARRGSLLDTNGHPLAETVPGPACAVRLAMRTVSPEA